MHWFIILIVQIANTIPNLCAYKFAHRIRNRCLELTNLARKLFKVIIWKFGGCISDRRLFLLLILMHFGHSVCIFATSISFSLQLRLAISFQN